MQMNVINSTRVVRRSSYVLYLIFVASQIRPLTIEQQYVFLCDSKVRAFRFVVRVTFVDNNLLPHVQALTATILYYTRLLFFFFLLRSSRHATAPCGYKADERYQQYAWRAALFVCSILNFCRFSDQTFNHRTAIRLSMRFQGACFYCHGKFICSK